MLGVPLTSSTCDYKKKAVSHQDARKQTRNKKDPIKIKKNSSQRKIFCSFVAKERPNLEDTHSTMEFPRNTFGYVIIAASLLILVTAAPLHRRETRQVVGDDSDQLLVQVNTELVLLFQNTVSTKQPQNYSINCDLLSYTYVSYIIRRS